MKSALICVYMCVACMLLVCFIHLPHPPMVLARHDWTTCSTKPFSQPTNPCSLRKAVQCFTEALAYLAQEQRFVSPSTTSSEQTPVSSTSGSTLTTEREEEKNENQMNDIAAVSVSEMQEYATLALAFVHLKLSNWVCVQSTLRRLLKNPMTNEYGR